MLVDLSGTVKKPLPLENSDGTLAGNWSNTRKDLIYDKRYWQRQEGYALTVRRSRGSYLLILSEVVDTGVSINS